MIILFRNKFYRGGLKCAGISNTVVHL